jgi:hypothetical protein
MAGRIAKIKQADGRLMIRSIEGEGSRNEKDTIVKSAEDPHADLIEAFRALEQHAREILEWPAGYAKGRVRITGASFSLSESTGVEGAVMTGQVALDETDAPFVFNTPHLPFEQYSETGASKLMPDGARDALEKLRAEAELFMRGKRAQGDFFFSSGAEKPTGKMAAAEQGADA